MLIALVATLDHLVDLDGLQPQVRRRGLLEVRISLSRLGERIVVPAAHVWPLLVGHRDAPRLRLVLSICLSEEIVILDNLRDLSVRVEVWLPPFLLGLGRVWVILHPLRLLGVGRIFLNGRAVVVVINLRVIVVEVLDDHRLLDVDRGSVAIFGRELRLASVHALAVGGRFFLLPRTSTMAASPWSLSASLLLQDLLLNELNILQYSVLIDGEVLRNRILILSDAH